MIRGLYTAALGMMTQMSKMDVVSNNLANSDTTGFKKDTTITQSFSDELTKRLDDPKYELIKQGQEVGSLNLGVFVNEISTDFTTGALKSTNNNMDFVINGDGFFAVSVMDKEGNITEKYTRDGAFSLTPDGTLVTKDGNFVLGEAGTITVTNSNIEINSDGTIYSNGAYVDKLKLVDFENKESLRKYGDNLYDTIDESVQTGFKGNVIKGMLEASNVNVVQEMVKMVSLSRAYEANQKMIQTHDSTLSRAVNDIGKKA